MCRKLFLKPFIPGDRLREIFAQLGYYFVFLHQLAQVVVVYLGDGPLYLLLHLVLLSDKRSHNFVELDN